MTGRSCFYYITPGVFFTVSPLKLYWGLSHIFYGERQPFSEMSSKANAPQWWAGSRSCQQVNFPNHGDIAGVDRADLQSFACFVSRNGSSFVLENHLNNRIINGVVQRLIQGCRGTRVSLLCSIKT